MSDRDTVTTVRILGEEFRIRGASPDRITEIADYVDAKFRELESSGSVMDLKRRAVLVSMNIAEEVFQHKEELEQQQRRFETESHSSKVRTKDWQGRLRRCLSRLDAVPDAGFDA